MPAAYHWDNEYKISHQLRLAFNKFPIDYFEIVSSLNGFRMEYIYSWNPENRQVLNDICSGRIEQFNDYILNSNGLFDDIINLKDFISQREHYKRQYGNQLIEEGDFVIYKLYEIVLDD